MTSEPHGRPVVMVVGPLPPPIHGAARVTAQIVDNLRAIGAEVIAVDTSGIDATSRLPYHVARVGSNFRAAWLAWRWRHRRMSCYIAGAGGLGLWYQVFVVTVARAAGHRCTFHHHSYAYVTRKSAAMTALVRAGGPTLEHVALCEGMGRQLRETYPVIRSVRICSNAGLLAPPVPDENARVGQSFLVLGHLGNLSVEKGLDVVIDTLRRLRADGVPARLLLGGPTTSPAAADLLADAQAEFGDALEHLGPVASTAVETFYRRIDVFVFPSRYKHEAEPLVVLEASRCGVPTIAFRVGCLAALVHDPDWLVDRSADFAATAAAVVGQLAEGQSRHLHRERTLEHFVNQQRSAIDAQRRLSASLAHPDPGSLG